MSWEPFFLISRALSATAGVATVFVVYRLARKLWDEATALVAALFLALAFIHARDSHFGTTDIAMTLLIVGSVSLLLSAHLTGRRDLFALAGLLGGFATATKYNGAFLAAPFVVSQLLHAMDSPGRRAGRLVRRAPHLVRRPVRRWPWRWAFPSCSPMPTGSWWRWAISCTRCSPARAPCRRRTAGCTTSRIRCATASACRL